MINDPTKKLKDEGDKMKQSFQKRNSNKSMLTLGSSDQILSFLPVQDIGSMEFASREYRAATQSKILWKYLISKYFQSYIEFYPELKKLAESDTSNSKSKFRKIFQYLLKVQRSEIKKLQVLNSPDNEIYQGGDPVLNTTDIKSIIDEKSYKEIQEILFNLSSPSLPENTPKTFAEAFILFQRREKLLDQINSLIVKAILFKKFKDNSSDKDVYLSKVISRLTEESIKLLDEFEPTSLYLIDCSLFAIRRDLFQVSSLKVLYLSGNNLTHIDFSKHQLNLIEKLDLTSNLLTAWPKGLISLHTLRTLSVGNFKPTTMICTCCDQVGQKTTGNKFDAIPDEIESLKNLEYLSIRSLGLKQLSTALTKLTSLRVLDFAHNEITVVPPEIYQLPGLRENGLLAIGNPMIKWLPLYKMQGKLNSKLHAADQMSAHYYYSKPVIRSKDITCGALSLISRSICWMYSKVPGKANISSAITTIANSFVNSLTSGNTP